MTAHKHAALMLQYAEDAQITDKPWELWETRYYDSDCWAFLLYHPVWNEDHQYRRKSEKWEPVGGNWLVNISGEAFEITSSKYSKELALERPTREQAERAAVEMRKFNRLLALRDELCGDEQINWDDVDKQKYTVVFNVKFKKWGISTHYYIRNAEPFFTTKESAQRARDMLNSGEVEL